MATRPPIVTDPLLKKTAARMLATRRQMTAVKLAKAKSVKKSAKWRSVYKKFVAPDFTPSARASLGMIDESGRGGSRLIGEVNEFDEFRD